MTTSYDQQSKKARSRNKAEPARIPPRVLPVQRGGSKSEPITVIVADDHAMIRQGICSVLEGCEGIEVVGQVRDGNEAVELAGREKPQVVMIDVQMPYLNGIEATERIRQKWPNTSVLGTSSIYDATHMKQMFVAGATGYMFQDASIDQMLTAIETVSNGETYLCPRACSLMIEAFMLGESTAEVSPLAALTPREREVAQLLSEGHSTKEIAGQLHVSVKTIDTHRYQVLTKLDLRGIADLTRLAIKEGLSSLESGDQKSDVFSDEKL